MNSIWNKNIGLFKKRFPKLFELLNLKEYDFSKSDEDGDKIKLFQAKNSQVSGILNGLLLHSKYDPGREAKNLLSKIDEEKCQGIIFFSFGLAYGPLEAARTFMAKGMEGPVLILIEKDKSFLEAALSAIDLQLLFDYPKLLFIIDASEKDTETLLQNYKKENSFIYSIPSQGEHAKNYYKEVESFLEKNSRKEEINSATLEKFSHLWLRNSLKNMHYLYQLDGIKKFFQKANDIPFTILAAGPSLKKICPHLKEIKKRSLLIAVDTALHACLKEGVEPDFIIIMDPQYYCARHLDFLKSPSSILILESAVYPSVFDFDCKEKVLCTSMFPPGQFFEKKIGLKGIIKAGGSVTTSAWDFAFKCGTKEIFLAGMDLGFPGKETHVKGSQFEEKIHTLSNRFKSAETFNIQSLLSGGKVTGKDYDGNDIFTDEKMSVFKWWFEEACQEAKKAKCQTYSLTSQSLAVKNIEKFSVQDFLKKENLEEKKEKFFKEAEKESQRKKENSFSKEDFKKLYKAFQEDLSHLKALVLKALDLVKKAKSFVNDKNLFQKTNEELTAIDKNILTSSTKEAAALIFPSQRQLEKLLSQNKNEGNENPALTSLNCSQIIYSQLLKALNEYIQMTEKYEKINLSF